MQPVSRATEVAASLLLALVEGARQAGRPGPQHPSRVGAETPSRLPFPIPRCGQVSEYKHPASRRVPLGPQNNQLEHSVASGTRESISAFFQEALLGLPTSQ